MVFTNVSEAGIYLQCCHREVEPGGTFYVPWLKASHDRGLVAAMQSGNLAWTSEKDEPTVPGSPAPDRLEKKRAAQRKAASAKAEAEAAAVRQQEAEQTAAQKANMTRMGRFDVPQLTRYEKVKAVRTEKPVTAADVIAGDSGPKSLADIRRHNKAVKTLGRKA